MKYILTLKHPQTHQIAFIRRDAEIEKICYSDNPDLPGTSDPYEAKMYETEEAAKRDCYLLKYHFRQFCSIEMEVHPIIDRRNLSEADKQKLAENFYRRGIKSTK